MLKNKKIITAVIAIVGVLAIALVAFAINANDTHSVEAEPKTTKVSKKAKAKAAKKAAAKKEDLDEWKHPSESKAYPDLNKYKDAYIEVSIAKQRVYIKNDNDVLYTMKAATGSKDSPTPKGNFQIQNRGDHFYNAESKEGANYWTSFKDWGVYLFHSVPTDEKGKYVESEAHKLGKPSSHGCVRLTIPDAKWINSTVPDGMKVIVK